MKLGKLSLSRTIENAITTTVNDGLQILPTDLDHVFTLSQLPNRHRNPFDRLLIAQALFEGLTIVTRDENIGQYSDTESHTSHTLRASFAQFNAEHPAD